MLGLTDLRALRQEIFQVAAPARRVLAGPVPADLRPIENRLDPTSDPTGGLSFFRPDRLNGFHYEPGIDVRDRKGAEDGIDIGRQGVRPLIRMLGISPAGAVRRDVRFGASLERHGLRGLELGPLALRPPVLDRVHAFEAHPPTFGGLLAGHRQSDSMEGAEAHLPLAVTDAKFENPGSAGFRDLQVKAPTV